MACPKRICLILPGARNTTWPPRTAGWVAIFLTTLTASTALPVSNSVEFHPSLQYHPDASFTPEQSREQRVLPANLAHTWHGKHKDFNSVGFLFYFFSKWCHGLHIVLQDMYLNICNYFCCTLHLLSFRKSPSAGHRNSLDPPPWVTKIQRRHETGVRLRTGKKRAISDGLLPAPANLFIGIYLAGV